MIVSQFTVSGPVTVKAESAVVLPTLAPKVVPPFDESESACAPFIVAAFPKAIVLPDAFAETDVCLPSVTGFSKLIFPAVDLIVAAPVIISTVPE